MSSLLPFLDRHFEGCGCLTFVALILMAALAARLINRIGKGR